MNKRIAIILCAALLAIFPGCRKKTRTQKKIDKVTKERIVSNF